jgi:methionyl-tRNA formyltransferase
MRFILLGSGKIAEAFLSRPEFEIFVDKNLVGIAGSKELNKLAQDRYEGLDAKSVIYIGDKNRTEKTIEKLIKEKGADFVLSIQYPWILSGDFLRVASNRVLNLHNARLPDYRGHNSISHEILNEESEHTTTLHWVAEEVDRGQIIATRNIPIENDDTAFNLWSRSVESALVLLRKFLENASDVITESKMEPVPMGGRYYSKDQIAQLKVIPAHASLEKIDRIARAFWFPPHEPAYFLNGNRKLYVLPYSFSYSF